MKSWPNWGEVDYAITHRAQAMGRGRKHYTRAESNKAADSLIRRMYGRNAVVDRAVVEKIRDLLWNTYDGPTGYRGFHLESVAKKGRRKLKALGYPVRFNPAKKGVGMKKNSTRKRVAKALKKYVRTANARRKNPAKSVSLTNFTGRVVLNADKTVGILGVQKKGKR